MKKVFNKAKEIIKVVLVAWLEGRALSVTKKIKTKKELEVKAKLQLNQILNLLELEIKKRIPHSYWPVAQISLAKQLLKPDALKNFLRCEKIKETMNETYALFLIKEYFVVLTKIYQYKFNKAILQDYAIGNPVPFCLNRKTSGNLVHHLYHIFKYLDFLGQNSQKKLFELSEIYEFGGGYGNMCRLFFKLGFRGRYYIQDLPILNVLQKFFLGNIALQNEILKKKWPAFKNIVFTDEVPLLSSKLNNKRLYVATWSLSECPPKVRKQQHSVLNKCNYFLIGFRESFEGLNNKEYFAALCSTRPDISWKVVPIPHLPESYYLFGKPKLVT